MFVVKYRNKERKPSRKGGAGKADEDDDDPLKNVIERTNTFCISLESLKETFTLGSELSECAYLGVSSTKSKQLGKTHAPENRLFNVALRIIVRELENYKTFHGYD